MKIALLIAGIAFLFLAFVMLAVSIGIFLYARKKRAAAGNPAAAGAVQSAPPAAPATPPPVPARAAVPVEDPDRTVFVPTTPRAGALACIAGPLAGQTFDVESNGTWIGRDRASAQIVIEDGRVSKRHVWVGLRQGTPTAVDNSSTNGTYINDASGERISEVVLHPGDVIIISDDVARFQYRA